MNRRTGEVESVKDKRSKALELRIAGGSYRAIAREMHCSQQSAFRYVQDALAELDKLTKERAERLRDLEIARCDKLTLALWSRAKQGDEKSVNAIVRVMDRRAKLLGLDAPEKHEVAATLNVDDTRESIARKLARLGPTADASLPVVPDRPGDACAGV